METTLLSVMGTVFITFVVCAASCAAVIYVVRWLTGTLDAINKPFRYPVQFKKPKHRPLNIKVEIYDHAQDLYDAT